MIPVVTLVLVVVLLSIFITSSNAFSFPSTTVLYQQQQSCTATKLAAVSTTNSNNEIIIGNTIFSGEPTMYAQGLNIRQVIRDGSIFTVNEELVTMDDIIGDPISTENNNKISIVVFLRSLG
jgi:hypothetical protein